MNLFNSLELGDKVTFKTPFGKIVTGIIVDFIGVNHLKVYVADSQMFYTQHFKELL